MWWVVGGDSDEMTWTPHHINGTFYQAETEQSAVESSAVFVVTAGLARLRWQQALAVAWQWSV